MLAGALDKSLRLNAFQHLQGCAMKQSRGRCARSEPQVHRAGMALTRANVRAVFGQGETLFRVGFDDLKDLGPLYRAVCFRDPLVNLCPTLRVQRQANGLGFVAQ